MKDATQTPTSARSSLDGMYALLNAPTREEQFWRDLNRAERKTLLRHAGLDTTLRTKPWNKLLAHQQKGVVEAAIRASQWAARKLRIFWVAPGA